MAGVDAATERVVFNLLHELRDQGKTVLVVHHDLRTVPKYFDYVVLLNMRARGQRASRGCVHADESSEDLRRPAPHSRSNGGSSP